MRKASTAILELLEARKFLSAPHHRMLPEAHVAPVATHHKGHHHHHHHGVTRSLPGGAPRNALTSTLLGNWIGSHYSEDDQQTPDATLSLRVTQGRSGDIFGQVDLTGPGAISKSSQILYNNKNGHFTLYVVTPKLVVRMEGLLTSNRETPELRVSIQCYTQTGSYKGNFTLLPTL
jgi:hypothetical protein